MLNILRKNKAVHIIVIVLIVVFILLVAYFSYLFIAYNRIDDNIDEKPVNNSTNSIKTNKSYSITLWNIGFGAKTSDFSYFFDGGKCSKGIFEDKVKENMTVICSTINSLNSDFIALQEVDVNSTRSYHINELEMLRNTLLSYSSTYSKNLNTPFVLYPLTSPYGKNKSGIATFANYKISSCIKKRLPAITNTSRIINLDSSYSITYYKLNNGKKLCIYNVQLNNDSSNSLIKKQLKTIIKNMSSEFAKGNYCICAGDFNSDLLNDSSYFFGIKQRETTNKINPFNYSLIPDNFTVTTSNNIPTYRTTRTSYSKNNTFVCSTDGFITTSYIEVLKSETINLNFRLSNHNPIQLKFKLN